MFKNLTVEDWKDEINEGLEFRRRYGLEQSWLELEELFYHVHKSNLVHGPNLISMNGDILLSSLGVPYPYIGVRARKSIYVDSARVQESIDNMLVCDMDMPDAVDTCMLYAYLWGPGILKIGYDSEFGWDPRFDIGAARGEPTGMSVSQFDKREQLIEFGMAQPGMPWVAPVLPHDFVVPWGTRNLRTAPWCVHRVCRHIDDVKADSKYSNTRDLRPVMSREDMMRSYTSTIKPYRLGSVERYGDTYSNDVDHVELWEIHDRRTGEMIVIATGHPKFLRREKSSLMQEGLPFVDITFTPRARSFWTTPDAFYLKAIQAELTDITIQSAKQRRISTLKWLVREGAMSNDELEKALSSAVGIAAKVKDTGSPLSESIMALQAPPNMMLYQEAEQTRRNGREIIGAGRNQGGEYEQVGRRTAREVAAVSEGSGLRMGRRQNALRRMYLEAFRKINPICWDHWKTPRIAEIVDDNGKAAYQSFVGEHLKGEYNYALVFSNAPDDSVVARRQSALMMYQMFANDPTVDPMELRKFVVNNMNQPEFTRIFQGAMNGQLPMGAGQAGNGLQAGQNGGGAPAGGGGALRLADA